MPKITIWMADGTRVEHVGHVTMSPDERLVTLMDDDCGIIDDIPYADIIEVKIDLLEE